MKYPITEFGTIKVPATEIAIGDILDDWQLVYGVEVLGEFIRFSSAYPRKDGHPKELAHWSVSIHESVGKLSSIITHVFLFNQDSPLYKAGLQHINNRSTK